jgi:hypothetical protein
MADIGWPEDSQRKVNDYFHKRDRELIVTARRQAVLEAQLRDLSGVTGLTDRQLLRDLQRVGYSAATASLLDLVPVVQVAWSDGGIDAQEREQIFAWARADGIGDDDPGAERLAQWLETRPSDEFFEATLRAVRALLENLPPAERVPIERKLVRRCRSVAAVSGGFLGLGPRISNVEESAIGRIISALVGGSSAGAGG